jgi:hypothetical protein
MNALSFAAGLGLVGLVSGVVLCEHRLARSQPISTVDAGGRSR